MVAVLYLDCCGENMHCPRDEIPGAGYLGISVVQ